LTRPELAGGVGPHRRELIWVEVYGHLWACLSAEEYHGRERFV
jgi:hypothetical protein